MSNTNSIVSTNRRKIKIEPILGKRKFNNAFDSNEYDDSRYNQHIDGNFFVKNIGHNVINNKNIVYNDNFYENK